MHQHTCIGDIIGMVIFNLEVVDSYRSFENLVLDLFNDYILTVDQNQNITLPHPSNPLRGNRRDGWEL